MDEFRQTVVAANDHRPQIGRVSGRSFPEPALHDEAGPYECAHLNVGEVRGSRHRMRSQFGPRARVAVVETKDAKTGGSFCRGLNIHGPPQCRLLRRPSNQIDVAADAGRHGQAETQDAVPFVSGNQAGQQAGEGTNFLHNGMGVRKGIVPPVLAQDVTRQIADEDVQMPPPDLASQAEDSARIEIHRHGWLPTLPAPRLAAHHKSCLLQFSEDAADRLWPKTGRPRHLCGGTARCGRDRDEHGALIADAQP